MVPGSIQRRSSSADNPSNEGTLCIFVARALSIAQHLGPKAPRPAGVSVSNAVHSANRFVLLCAVARIARAFPTASYFHPRTTRLARTTVCSAIRSAHRIELLCAGAFRGAGALPLALQFRTSALSKAFVDVGNVQVERASSAADWVVYVGTVAGRAGAFSVAQHVHTITKGASPVADGFSIHAAHGINYSRAKTYIGSASARCRIFFAC